MTVAEAHSLLQLASLSVYCDMKLPCLPESDVLQQTKLVGLYSVMLSFFLPMPTAVKVFCVVQVRACL